MNRSVKNKAEKSVFEALMHVRRVFPFPIIGIDSANGSEFINHHLFEYCRANTTTFTRSRVSHSNDGAHVEQKNWTHARELVGHHRCGTPAELALLDEIWELDRVFTNYLPQQQKLVFKQRNRSESDQTIRHRDHPAPARHRSRRHAQDADHQYERGIQESPPRGPVETNPRARWPTRDPLPGQKTRQWQTGPEPGPHPVSSAEVFN